MGSLLRRAILPLLLLAVGIASIVYGTSHHTEQVFEEQEIEIALAPPPLPSEMNGPPGFGGPSEFGGLPGELQPFGAPPPELQKVKQKVYVGTQEPELALVRDVTIGGLERLASGELRRTYSGAPPSLCPT